MSFSSISVPLQSNGAGYFLFAIKVCADGHVTYGVGDIHYNEKNSEIQPRKAETKGWQDTLLPSSAKPPK